MKVKQGFLLREVAGQIVALPTSGTLDFNQMITLNSTGKFLWEKLQQETNEEELTVALLENYEVDEETARNAVRTFVQKLRDNDLVE